MDDAGGARARARAVPLQRAPPRGRRDQQKVLASTLRDLEENGFVSRTVTPVTPPQVEYALTGLGRDLLCPVQALAEWVVANSAHMEAARAAYAARRGQD